MDNVNNNNSIIEQQDNNDVEINYYEYDPIAEKCLMILLAMVTEKIQIYFGNDLKL